KEAVLAVERAPVGVSYIVVLSFCRHGSPLEFPYECPRVSCKNQHIPSHLQRVPFQRHRCLAQTSMILDLIDLSIRKPILGAGGQWLPTRVLFQVEVSWIERRERSAATHISTPQAHSPHE
ncbi:MAG: hypothetical protein ONB05_03000, partial [candidate division KSB1 bacterium]|nr:hypothetical protein [candidate division KSB1 bacterium]